MRNYLSQVAGIGLAATMTLAVQSSAQAFDFNFSFDDDAAANLFGRTHVSGTVSGRIIGLNDNQTNQIPSQLILDSIPAGLGLDDYVGYDLLPTADLIAGGFDVSGGIIQEDSGFVINNTDFPAGIQFRINFISSGTDYNWLLANGGSSPLNTGSGNDGGFAGVSFSSFTPTSVPFGVSTDLSILILGGLYGASRLRKTIADSSP